MLTQPALPLPSSQLLQLFGSADSAPRVQALLLIRQVALVLPQPALDNCLKVQEGGKGVGGERREPGLGAGGAGAAASTAHPSLTIVSLLLVPCLSELAKQGLGGLLK